MFIIKLANNPGYNGADCWFDVQTLGLTTMREAATGYYHEWVARAVAEDINAGRIIKEDQKHGLLPAEVELQ